LAEDFQLFARPVAERKKALQLICRAFLFPDNCCIRSRRAGLCRQRRYLDPLLLLEDFRPTDWLPVLPEAFFIPVLPRICAAFLAVTGTVLRPFPLVVPADFRLLTFSFAILTVHTFFLAEVPSCCFL
jgi:hypothetical protein